MKYLLTTLLVGCLLTSTAALCQTTPSARNEVQVLRFVEGGWDKGAWQPARLANQPAPVPWVQLKDSIGTTPRSFTPQDFAAETDNAILVHDLGLTEYEISVTLKMGEHAAGGGNHATPGLCISPLVKDGVVLSSLGVFVADYTVAVWQQSTAADGKTVQHRHVVQLGRGFDPAQRHTLRCRVSKKEGSIAFQVDDSEAVVLTYVGHKTYGLVPQELNSQIGLWACHGESSFYNLSIYPQPTLSFIKRH